MFNLKEKIQSQLIGKGEHLYLEMKKFWKYWWKMMVKKLFLRAMFYEVITMNMMFQFLLIKKINLFLIIVNVQLIQVMIDANI